MYETTSDGRRVCPRCGAAIGRSSISSHARTCDGTPPATTRPTCTCAYCGRVIAVPNFSRHLVTCEAAHDNAPEVRAISARELADDILLARIHLAAVARARASAEVWKCADCGSDTHAPSVRDPSRCGWCVVNGPPPPKPEIIEGRLYCQDCGDILPRECDKRRLYCDACGKARNQRYDQRRNRVRSKAEVDA